MAQQEKANPIEVQQYLGNVEYPATKEDLVEHARKQDASDSIVETLEEIPDREYVSAADVSKGIGESNRNK